MSGGHGHIEGSNKKIVLLVAVLAALLAISEMGGKSSQTNALASHIDGSNLWNFFQAKTIRQTTLRTAAEEAEATFKDSPQGMPTAMKVQTERWLQTAQRYETEPETSEGRKELMARAKAKEEHRDKSLAELNAARQIAPQLTRYHPQVHETVTVLAESDRRTTGSLTGFARWAGSQLELHRAFAWATGAGQVVGEFLLVIFDVAGRFAVRARINTEDVHHLHEVEDLAPALGVETVLQRIARGVTAGAVLAHLCLHAEVIRRVARKQMKVSDRDRA